jgi:hypothetical protein
MNNDQFDNLSRKLANGVSRRDALKLLGAGIAASWFSSLVPKEAIAQGPLQCGVKTVKIWMKAFIPRDIPGYTKTVPDGPYQGQTMIPGPFRPKGLFGVGFGECYLTDGRDFSSDILAGSRLTSILDIDVQQGRIINDQNGFHYSDATVRLDCFSGIPSCQQVGIPRGKFYDLWVSPDGQTITIKLQAAANNPCAPGSPDIDYKGTIIIKLLDSGQGVLVNFDGLVEPFPAFEMYASADDGEPKAIFPPVSPLPGKTPWNLVGNPNRLVSGFVLLDGKCPNGQPCCHGTCCDDCQMCDPTTGTCVSTCSACQTCDTVSGTCVSTCGVCQTCQAGTCVDLCGPGTHCDPATGSCVSICTACETYDPATNTCVSTCLDCETCQNGTCVSVDCECQGITCDECMHCENGLCVRTCTDTEVCCGDQCINPSEYTCCITRDNGTFPCLPGWHCCAGGECCPPNEQCCGGQCVPYDRDHCANCFPCGANQVCCIGDQGQIYGCDELVNCPK